MQRVVRANKTLFLLQRKQTSSSRPLVLNYPVGLITFFLSWQFGWHGPGPFFLICRCATPIKETSLLHVPFEWSPDRWHSRGGNLYEFFFINNDQKFGESESHRRGGNEATNSQMVRNDIKQQRTTVYRPRERTSNQNFQCVVYPGIGLQ